MLVNFVKGTDWPHIVVAVDVMLEVFVELGAHCVANVLAHRSDEAADGGPVAVENIDGVVGGAKLCGCWLCWQSCWGGCWLNWLDVSWEEWVVCCQTYGANNEGEKSSPPDHS